MSYSLLKEITILIVEDNESELEEMGSLLDIYFKKCYRAKDGEEGYELFTKNRVDIVMSDIGLPKLDGFGMINKIRTIDKSVAIVIHTVFTNIDTFLNAIKYGVSDFVLKPATATKILDTLLKASANIIRDRELKKEQLLTQIIFEKFPYKIMITDLENNILLTNSPFKNSLHLDDTKREKCHEVLYGLKEPCNTPQRVCNKGRIIKTGVGDTQWHAQIKDGNKSYLEVETVPLKDEDGKVYSLLKIIKDRTEEKTREIKLEKMANYDILTGLPNRILLYDRLEQAMLRSNRSREEFAFLFIDIDDFKSINDRYGHRCGDILLKKISKRVTSAIRKIDTLARFGGDEFVLILESVSSVEQCRVIVEEIFNRLKKGFKLTDDIIVNASCSIGIDLYSPLKKHKSKEELIQNADIAMYEAKKSGKDRFQFFEGN